MDMEAACQDMKEECILNPIEVMWGANDEEDTIE